MPDSAPPQPFNESERVRLRIMLDAFEDMSASDFIEMKKLTKSTGAAKTVLLFLGRLVMWLGGATTLIIAVKSLLSSTGKQ